MNNKIIWFFRFLVGGLFILSAISKLLPVEAFDLFLVNQGIANWALAPYFSRLLIVAELFLGISFFIAPFVKKISVPFSFLLLIVFCIHLIFLISTGSGSKNCGCFGEIIPMSSVDALIKNVVLLILIFFINKYFKFESKIKYSFAFALFSLVFAGIFLLFQIKPYNIPPKDEVQITTFDSTATVSNSIIESKDDTAITKPENDLVVQKDETKEVKGNPPPKTVSEFASFKQFSDNQTVNLDEGIKLVCLFSLDCEDCMETARKLGTVKNEWSNFPPLYILFLGEQEQVKGFFDFAGVTFLYKIIPAQTFFPLIKNYPPRVVLLNNGKIIDEWSYENFSLENLQNKL